MIKFLLLCYCVISFSMAQATHIDSTKIKIPSVAWKLSLIPGMGQFYNEKYIKSASFMMAGTYAFMKRNEFSETGQIGKRNTYSWWLFGLYVWGMLDAYVDAQLSTFPTEKNNNFENEGDE
ncbi:MAG: hypothetical protein HOM61_05990 [Candidatus Marinimicrobia bacterium]|jgi:hypothetical protein|nr:hypothetical protein [Candidatus Neomarinimicrobiota bacterium]